MNEEIIIITTTPTGSKIKTEIKQENQSEYKKWAGEDNIWDFIVRMRKRSFFSISSVQTIVIFLQLLAYFKLSIRIFKRLI